MKSTISAADLKAALKKLGKVAPKECSIDALKGVRMDFRGSKCTMTATDLDQWLTVELKAQGDSFSFLIPEVKNVLKGVNYFSGEMTVSLEHGGALTLENGGKTLKMESIDITDFPDPRFFEALNTYEVAADELYTRCKKVRYAADSGRDRESYMGIRFEGSSIYALDGYRVAINHAGPGGLCVEKPFQLRTSMVDFLPMFGSETVSLKIGARYAAVEGAGCRLDSRLVTWTDFDLDAVIPKAPRDEYEVSLEQYAKDMAYLNEFVKDNRLKYAAFDAGRCSIPNKGEPGQVDVAVELELLKGRPTIRFGFNPKYMVDCTQQFKGNGSDVIQIKVSSPLIPIVLTDGGQDLALVSPYRLTA